MLLGRGLEEETYILAFFFYLFDYVASWKFWVFRKETESHRKTTYYPTFYCGFLCIMIIFLENKRQQVPSIHVYFSVSILLGWVGTNPSHTHLPCGRFLIGRVRFGWLVSFSPSLHLLYMLLFVLQKVLPVGMIQCCPRQTKVGVSLDLHLYRQILRLAPPTGHISTQIRIHFSFATPCPSLSP